MEKGREKMRKVEGNRETKDKEKEEGEKRKAGSKEGRRDQR